MKLDFGCGDNPAPGHLKCDITENPMLDFRFDRFKSRIDFAENAAFEGVSLRNVIHHVEDLPALFKELNRVVKPGGEVLIEDCRPECYNANRVLDNLWYRFVIPHDEIFISQQYRDYVQPALAEGFLLDRKEFEREKERIILKKKSFTSP